MRGAGVDCGHDGSPDKLVEETFALPPQHDRRTTFPMIGVVR